MSFDDHLDLDRAFERIWRDKRDDAWPDIVGYRDYRRRFRQSKEQLEALLREPAKYQAQYAPCIDLPKKGFTLRPGVVPCIQDRIVYQALADVFAPYFQPEPTVYSNRLADPRSKTMFQPGVRLWKAFQDEIEGLCGQHRFVVETDITAYFDHIYHRLLYDRLQELFRDRSDGAVLKESKALLKRLLGRWKGTTLKGFGIPQINDASSFWGNLYLDEIDKWLKAHGYTSLRYVDDLRIFASLAVAHDDLLLGKIDIFDPQPQAFYQAQAGAVEQPGDQLLRAGHGGKYLLDLFAGEDGGQALGFLGPNGVEGPFQVLFEHVLIQEEDGAERLVLGGGSDVLVHGQVGEKRLYFGSVHLGRVAHVVEVDIAFNPIGIGFLGANGVMLGPYGITNAVQQFLFAGFCHGSSNLRLSFRWCILGPN